MKKLITVALFLTLAVPAAFAVPPSPGSASQLCKEQRKAIGQADFRALYAPNGSPKAAMDACLAKQATTTTTDAKNAAKACKAEQAAGVDAFNTKYGKNGNMKNAFGKCVSSKAQDLADARQDATLNAAKKCKAERALGAAAFTTKYGTPGTKNAFGKCVSKNAKPAAS